MNISSVNSSSQLSYLESLKASQTLAPPKEEKLDDFLTSQGLSPDQQASLKADLQAAIQTAFESGGFPPDPETMKSSINEVFEKYGIDSDSLAAQFDDGGGYPPPGKVGPPSGSSSTSSTSENDSTTQLLNMLNDIISGQGDNSEKSSEEYSAYLYSAMMGLDVEA